MLWTDEPSGVLQALQTARSSVTSSDARTEGLGFIAAKAVFYLDWSFASGSPDYFRIFNSTFAIVIARAGARPRSSLRPIVTS